jgi:hypothetical protein
MDVGHCKKMMVNILQLSEITSGKALLLSINQIQMNMDASM